jgi:two-component system cell cycle response regulator
LTERNLSKINVLVIDREEDARKVAGDILVQEGYKVYLAASQEEGLRLMKPLQFQIIIADLVAPDQLSLQALEVLRSSSPLSSIIVTTSSPSIKSAVEAIRHGAYDYITKPYDIEELKITLLRAAERHFLLNEASEKEYYKELSVLDGLTGLYNYRYFDELISREISRAKRYPQEFSLLMIDIDEFKKYNDKHGHPQGDELLKQIAKIFLQSIRCVDMVFRYGGEEFVIILPQTPIEGAVVVSKRILNIVKSKIPVSVSIGVATFPADASTKKGLIECADQALYRAKALGKCQVCVFERNVDSKKPEADEK